MIWEHNNSCDDLDQIINVPRFYFLGETTQENMVKIRADNGESRIVCGPYLILEKLDDCCDFHTNDGFESYDEVEDWPDWFADRVRVELGKLKKIGIVHGDSGRDGNKFLV
ncbi:unnamed protein product [Ambrosiozyma monospora]|uniref:Unnamed protein product n=1 Tax=Ambrosiozyma monospora TaxID=43982 RepID=A0ACB5TEA4_AMBMO|nr:unnamed protein product [Ambrosiozyma monospora]